MIVTDRRDFVDDLLGGYRIGDLAQRAERYGLQLPGTAVVAAARAADPFEDGRPVTEQVEAGLCFRFGRRDVMTCTDGGLLVCVAPQHLSTAVIDEFVRVLGEALGEDVLWQVGVGMAHSGPGGTARSYDQARTALEIGWRLDLPERVLSARDLLVYQVLWRDSAALAELVAAVLEPLRTARIGPGPLVDTLYAYFLAGGVATVAARRLGVGVRTVTYRLQRVEALTGYAVDDQEQAFTLQTAVLGARLIGWPGSGADS